MRVGNLGQGIEAIDRGDDITTHFFQQSFSGATNRFRIVDHHHFQTLGMLFHVRPTIASVSRYICVISMPEAQSSMGLDPIVGPF